MNHCRWVYLFSAQFISRITFPHFGQGLRTTDTYSMKSLTIAYGSNFANIEQSSDSEQWIGWYLASFWCYCWFCICPTEIKYTIHAEYLRNLSMLISYSVFVLFLSMALRTTAHTQFVCVHSTFNTCVCMKEYVRSTATMYGWCAFMIIFIFNTQTGAHTETKTVNHKSHDHKAEHYLHFAHRPVVRWFHTSIRVVNIHIRQRRHPTSTRVIN